MHLITDFRPLIYRQHSLRRMLDCRFLYLAPAASQGSSNLVGCEDLDLWLRCQDAFDEVGLQSGEHRRHQDDHSDADGNTADDKCCLHPAFLEEADCRSPFKWHPAVHGSTGLMR